MMRLRGPGAQLVLLIVVMTGLGAARRGSAAGLDVRLANAARQGDVSAVRALLQQRVDLNAAGPDGTTALHWAVHRDSLDVVTLMIAAGARVEVPNRYGVTPLALACLNGHPGIIQVLLKAGANPNTLSADGETALMTAARTGNAEAVKLLIAHGAGVNATETWRGQTALMWAVSENHEPVVRVLVDGGADVRARSTKGFSAFLFAIRGGHPDIARELLAAGGDVNEAAGDGTTALVMAIVNAHYELAAWLLDQGANPNVETPGGTALHALVRTRDYEYGTVVRPAARQTGDLSALDLVEVLFRHQANANARIVKPLPRQGGFDNNYLKLVGATPFLLAARAADPIMMRRLLEHGADPALATAEDVTPLMVAAGMGYVQGQSIGAEADRRDAVALLLELGADVRAVSTSGETAMHGAATGGVNDIVRMLVANGAPLDARAKDGTTPLAIADGTKSAFRAWPHTAELLRELLAKTEAEAR
jgi:ankyrin repeat protein